MNLSLQPQIKGSISSFTPVSTNCRQRKCACGGTPGVDGECTSCRARRLSLQKQAAAAPQQAVIPPIVHEVLRAPGQPLDPTIRAFMEPRFGHDFSLVRVHTDSRAAESARAVNALAYTVGRDVVFATQRYAPASLEGCRLLAHELTHVVQQAPGSGRRVALPHSAAHEHEADEAAASVLTGRRPAAPRLRSGEILARQVDGSDLPPSELSFPFIRTMTARAEPELEPNSVYFSGLYLIVIQGGKKVAQVDAFSGHPGTSEAEKNVGPIPDGTYHISPHLTNPPVKTPQGGICSAAGISHGYQELTSENQQPCDNPNNHYCTVACPTPEQADRRCYTPVGCWGHQRIKIEGSATVTTKEGKQIVRDGFYIHGGDHSVTVTSGCIKVTDDAIFNVLRQFKGRVPLLIRK